MMKICLLIGLGGFAGSISRYLLSRWMVAHLQHAFPVGTFVVNILGCLLMGLILGLAERSQVAGIEWRMFLTVGFCGGFTTFSAFAAESFYLLRTGEWLYLGAYILLSVVFGLLAVYGGFLLSYLIKGVE